MGKNSYLEKQNAVYQAMLDIGVNCGKQQMADYLVLALRDPEVMGRNIFGRSRIDKIIAAMEALDREYAGAYTVEKEADHLQEKLDRKLREVYGDELVPFRERQPAIKQVGYSKSRKGWK